METVTEGGWGDYHHDFESIRRQPKPKVEPEVKLTKEQKMAKYFEESKRKSEEIMKDLVPENQNVRTRKSK